MDNQPDNTDVLETIGKLKSRTPVIQVRDGFENVVFNKIKRKKKQRRLTAAVASVVLLGGFLFLAQAVFFNNPGNGTRNFALSGQLKSDKEEVPVVEDVVFSTSDSRSSYVIEQVGYTEGDGSF